MKEDRRILTAAILSGVFIWLLDAIADYFLYKGTFLGVLIFDIQPEKLVIRTFLFIYFLVMAFMLSRVFIGRAKSKGETTKAREDWGSTFDAVSDPVMVLDKDHRIVIANRATAKFLKRPEKEIIGRRCHELVHGTTKPPEFCPTSKVISTKKREEWEVQLPDGGPWLAVSVDPILDDKGKISGFVHIVKDVTKRKAIEEKLLFSLNVIEQSTEGFAAVDNNGNIIFSNKAFAGMHGYEPEELIGKKISIFHAPEQMPFVEAANRKLAETGEFAGEIWHMRRDGTVFPGWMHNTLLMDAQGRPVGVIGTLQDITERKKAEERVYEEEERYRKLFLESGIGCVINTPEGNILQANQAFCSFLGYSEAELLGRIVTDLMYPEDQKETIKAIRLLMAGGQPIKQDEKRYIHKSGEVRWGAANVSATCDHSGKPCYVAQIQDITERKRAEATIAIQERFSQSLLESMDAGVVACNEKGELVLFNRVAREWHGLDPTKISQNEWASYYDLYLEDGVTPMDLNTVPLARAFRGEILHGVGMVIAAKGKASRHILAHCAPIKGKDGRIVGAVAIMHDVTERKKAEERMREDEERYRKLFCESRVGGVVNDMDGKILQVNPAFCEFLGYPEVELIGRRVLDITYPEDVGETDEAMRQMMANTKPINRYEKRYMHKSGTVKWGEVNASAIHDAFGKPIYAIAQIQDITERKKAEEEARIYSTRLGYLTKYANDFIILLDEDFCFLETNERVIDFYGYTREELLGMHATQLRAPETRSLFIEQIKPLSATGKAVYETVHQRKDGTKFPVEISLRTVDVEGKRFYQAILRDITERKKTEDVLLESERRLREAQKMAHLGYWRWDVRTGDVEWSEEMFNIFRLDPTSFTPRIDSIMALSPWPGERERDQELIRRATESHEKGDYEQRFLLPDGSNGYYHSTFQGIYDDGGNLIYIIGTVQDITERKKAEEALRKSEATLKSVIAATPAGIGMAVDRVLVFANDQLCSMRGYAKEELVDKSVKSFYFTQEEFDRVGKELYDDIKMKGISSIETKWVRKDGEARDIYISAAALIPGDVSKGVVFAALDITENKKAEQKIKDIARFPKENPNPVMRVDCHGNILYANPASKEVLNAWETSQGGKVPGWFQKTLTEMCATERPTRKEVDVAGKVYSFMITPMPEEKYANVYGDDITEMKKAERELDNYRKHLEEMVKERTEELESFSYSVSHDLRAPIRAIDGFTRILTEEFSGKLDHEGKRILDVIVKSTKNMGQLIDDLLAFSRIGRRETQNAEIDTNALVKDIIEGLVQEPAGRKVELKTGDLPAAFGDRAMIQLVFVNLLSNALKFTRHKEDAHIEIGAEEKPGETVYFIRDNGVGFDMKYVSKLFGVFQRLHSQEEFEGTGIGLALIKRIIAKHGGRVWAEGEVGKGACFYFSLPRRNA